MSAVEHKKNGHFVRNDELIVPDRVPGDEAGGDWGTDCMLLDQENFS